MCWDVSHSSTDLSPEEESQTVGVLLLLQKQRLHLSEKWLTTAQISTAKDPAEFHGTTVGGTRIISQEGQEETQRSARQFPQLPGRRECSLKEKTWVFHPGKYSSVSSRMNSSCWKANGDPDWTKRQGGA